MLATGRNASNIDDVTATQDTQAHGRFVREFTDDGRWFVHDTKTNRKIKVGDRREGAFVLAEIFDAADPGAAFQRILAELGSIEDAPQSPADVVDAALALARKHSAYNPRAHLQYAVGSTGVGRAWSGGSWPEVKEAARDGDAVAVELLCRAADLAGLS
jgi:hypothetical protein